jgi:hypothetical protein
MDKSIYLYKELVSKASKILTDYLRNVPTFENQLKFEEINELCYQKMYEDIKDKESIETIQELYEKINGLKELYQRARKYYLNSRNKSIKGLDVQLGKQFEEVFIEFLNSKGIVAMRADTKNKRLPDIMVLDKTRNIKAYIELKYHNAPFMLAWRLLGRESYEGSITLDTEKLKKQLIEIDSELERPVYFVHWVDFPDLKGIFFNTHDQIKEYLTENPVQFIRKTRDGDYKEGEYKLQAKVGYTDKFYPPLHEMGDFEELLANLKP